jgi:hypothetical protein
MTPFGLEGIYIARCLGRGLGGTPSMRVRLCNHHQPTFPTLSYTHYTHYAFRYTIIYFPVSAPPAQPPPLGSSATRPHNRTLYLRRAQPLEVHTAAGSSGSLHSCWKFTQPLEVLEVCTAAGSSGSLHSRWKFTQPLEVLEVCTATGSSGSSHSHWKFWKFAQPLEVLQASKG